MIHLDAIYYAFLQQKTGRILNIKEPLKKFYRYRYVAEMSKMKNYLRLHKGRHLNIASAEEIFKFLSRYVKVK